MPEAIILSNHLNRYSSLERQKRSKYYFFTNKTIIFNIYHISFLLHIFLKNF